MTHTDLLTCQFLGLVCLCIYFAFMVLLVFCRGSILMLRHRILFGQWEQPDKKDDTSISVIDWGSRYYMQSRIRDNDAHTQEYGEEEVILIQEYANLALSMASGSPSPSTSVSCGGWYASGPLIFMVLAPIFAWKKVFSQGGSLLNFAKECFAAFTITLCLDFLLIGRAYWRMCRRRRSWTNMGMRDVTAVFEKEES